MKNKQPINFGISLTAGLALFAMFFGAGNMVFPLAIGAHAGHNLVLSLVGFLISGVGIPFLGVYAVALYKGDYWKFFNTLGKIPAFIIITFIILIIGPLFAGPRTETITFETIGPHVPYLSSNPHIFGLLYFIAVFALVYKHTHVVDLIGKFISPIKLAAFTTLIIISLLTAHALMPVKQPATHVFTHAMTTGYATMDLFAAFFFCHVAYKNIYYKCKRAGDHSDETVQKAILKACVIGATLIALIYTGFMISAAFHAQALAHTSTAGMINKLSETVFGNYGTLFVGLCVTLACLATATAVAVVSTKFFYKQVFRKKIPRNIILVTILGCMYGMSILGFNGIMSIATPLLNVLYPALIIFCFYNLIRKHVKGRLAPAKTTVSLPL